MHPRDDFGWCPVYVPGVHPCVSVLLDGLEFAAGGGRRSPSRLTLSGWDGWTNGVDSRGGVTPWESADGGAWGDQFFESRTIRLEGMIHGRTPDDLWESMEAVGAVLTRPRRSVLEVDETSHLGLVRQVEVERASRPLVTQVSPRAATFTLQVRAASHLRFGVDAQAATLTAGGVDLVNLGDMDAPVTVRLAGPLTNPGLSWPGGGWQYRGSVGSGTTLIVDMQRRIVRNPATSVRSRRDAGGDWLALPPGTTRVARTGSGSGSVRAEWRSAWA